MANDDQPDLMIIRVMVAKLDFAKRLAPQSGFEAFNRVLRILSQGTKCLLQDAYNACCSSCEEKRSAEEVDKEWGKIKFNDATLYKSQLQLLKKWFKEDSSVEDYESFCKRYVYDDDLDWDAALRGYMGLADMFIRKCRKNGIRLVASLNNSKSNSFAIYEWEPHTKLWSCAKYQSNNNEDRVLQFVVETIETMLSEMIFIANRKSKNETMTKASVKKMENQYSLVTNATPLKLKKNLVKLIHDRIVIEQGDEQNYYPSLELIPIANGLVLNIRTLESRERVQSDFFVCSCPVYYEPDDEVKCLDAWRYMRDLSGGISREMLDYMMQVFATLLLGYSKNSALMLTDFSDGRETEHFMRILKGIFGGSDNSCWIEKPKDLVVQVKAGGQRAALKTVEDYQASVVIGVTRICCIDTFAGKEALDTDKVRGLLEWNNNRGRGVGCIIVAKYDQELPSADFGGSSSMSKLVMPLRLYAQNIFNDEPDRKPIDPNNINDLSCIFSLLCRSLKPWFDNSKRLPSIIPEKILREMSNWEYHNSSFVSKFVEEMCHRVTEQEGGGKVSCIPTTTFHNAFETWFRKYYNAKDIPTPTKIKSEMHKLGFNVDESRRLYLGITLMQNRQV